MQVKAPGSFPVDPFFFLIALTYALTIVYAGTLSTVRCVLTSYVWRHSKLLLRRIGVAVLKKYLRCECWRCT